MSLRQKVSSLLMLHIPGTDVSVVNNYLDTYQPGGLIFMGDNIPTDITALRALTDGLQSNTNLPYLFAVDQEGGIVSRLPGDVYPAAIDLKNQLVDDTKTAFDCRSKLLAAAGLNVNFGIVADITGDTNSFIYPRVFGSDPKLAGEHVAAAVKASKKYALTTLKHFPGHGESVADSHSTIPTTNVPYTDWQLRVKPPFQAGIDASADIVMFGHLRYSDVDSVPASLSIKWHDILKNELKFDGIVITDDMIMLQNTNETEFKDPIYNAINAIRAGNTMLLYVLGPDNLVSGISIDEIIDGIVNSVSDDKLMIDTINKNAKKLIETRRSLTRFNDNH